MTIARKLMSGIGGIRLPEIGEPFEGGFYAGIIDSGTDRYALIVSPKSSGESGLLQYKTSSTGDTGAQSFWDGLSNISSTDDPAHPMVQFCTALSIDGFTDWYPPARDELELCYRNLKPTTTNNSTGSRVEGGSYGENANSDPVGLAYTTTDPQQTSVSVFQAPSGAEQFENAIYWTSTEYSGNVGIALQQNMDNGDQATATKINAYRVRAVRRIQL